MAVTFDPYAPSLVHPAPLSKPMAALHRLAFYPVLVTQGPFIKFRTERLQEPKGARQGVIGQGPDLRVLIVGDSSAAGVGVATQSQALSGRLAYGLAPYARLDWEMVARCGDTTPMALKRVKAAQPRRADVAVVALGVNDIMRGTRLARWLEQTEHLLDHLTRTIGVGHVYLSGLPAVSQFPRLPNPLRWSMGHQAERFDRGLRALVSTRDDTTLIPADMALTADNMARDGFHPGPKVYAFWADLIVAQIREDRGL
ncbi:SGNH/GDSL hydrolase family protein [Octadecabacter sp. G9-8]|uniref:SGNH/GDSL hydrolase family protein n=1 Tax=Octadecabacter dasysiphoniae TaxID=2909341 RepID=A0ABS9CZ12_9RHOB|nr:SGNH/GDSL hydrolase family protein [Octadecabacter dasysiphoniae]MCF2872483.1 SGNH/GDSL hydrolase family protein [Octadecabacter dasysiphoniae]